MKTYEGYIKYNEPLKCYGLVDYDGNWIKEALDDGDRFDIAIPKTILAANYKKEYAGYFHPHEIEAKTVAHQMPVLYYDFEKEPEPTKTEQPHQHWKFGLFAIGISIVFCAVLAAVFMLFSKGSYWVILAAIYAMFGAPVSLGGLLEIMKVFPENLCFGFGCALYYGTIVVARLLSGFVCKPISNSYILAFIYVALICYIAWLNYFKPDKTK